LFEGAESCNVVDIEDEDVEMERDLFAEEEEELEDNSSS